MPKGDPAGYLPNVVKSRKRKGEPAYQPRSKRGAPRASSAMVPGDQGGPPPMPGSLQERQNKRDANRMRNKLVPRAYRGRRPV